MNTQTQLPPGFEWHTASVQTDMDAIHRLLDTSYVESDAWKLNYSRKLLNWILKDSENVCVRVVASKVIVGFISASSFRCKGTDSAFINFLCVHKKLRNKKLTPVLIAEITKKLKAKGMQQAFYTSGFSYPNKIVTTTYYHRCLRVENLMQQRFIRPGNLSLLSKFYSLPKKSFDMRRLEEEDCNSLATLLNNYNAVAAQITIDFDEKLCQTMFRRCDDVHSFVLGDLEQVTDFVSFYKLPLKNKLTGAVLEACNLWYYACTTVSLERLIEVTLIVAKEMGYDVFNALDIFQNKSFISNLKFIQGSGTLNYYSYYPMSDEINSENVYLITI